MAAGGKDPEGIGKDGGVIPDVFQDVHAYQGVGLEPPESGHALFEVMLPELDVPKTLQTHSGSCEISVGHVHAQHLPAACGLFRHEFGDVSGTASQFEDALPQVRDHHARDPPVVVDGALQVLQRLAQSARGVAAATRGRVPIV
jgi:hypothetical protein